MSSSRAKSSYDKEMSPSNRVSMTTLTPPSQTPNIDYDFLVKLDQACSVKMAESIGLVLFCIFIDLDHRRPRRSVCQYAYKLSSKFFSRAKRELEIFNVLRSKASALGHTTGTGNEKRRTLRKSIHNFTTFLLKDFTFTCNIYPSLIIGELHQFSCFIIF